MTIYKVSTKDLPHYLVQSIRAGHVPFVQGSPGIGKSAVARTLAAGLLPHPDTGEPMKLKLIDLRLSQCDITDLNGLPSLVDGRLHWAPPADFPLEGDPLPEGFDGWLLFLDELNAANAEVQAAAYKVVLDRMVGQRRLHPLCFPVGAGNLDTDRAVTHRVGTAMASRLVHYEVIVDRSTFTDDVAIPLGWDHRVIAWLRFNQGAVHDFDPDRADRTFPCPRTWEFVSNYMKFVPEGAPPSIVTIAGCVGDGAATEFVAFVENMGKLPGYDDIVSDPTGTPVPEELSMQFAVASLLGSKARLEDFGLVVQYIDRLPTAMGAMAVRQIQARGSLITDPDFKAWVIRIQTRLHGSN